MTAERMGTRFVSCTVKFMRRLNPRANFVLKLLVPLMEQNLALFPRCGTGDGERWWYGQVFTVIRNLLFVDAVYFVLVAQVEVFASVGGRREEQGDGYFWRELGGPGVPYLSYVPPRARGLYGGGRRVDVGGVDVCSVSTVVPPG